MRQKKIKAIRKQIGLKLPVKPDLRILKEVEKVAYLTDKFGVTKAIPTKRIVIVNAAKAQYKQIKKLVKGQRSL